MVFEHIEKLKREYTDKYVVVDGEVAELRRFRAMTGIIKTINMNGRALVEFDGYLNTGWYDIDLDFLKVVDQPQPKADEPPKKAAKPAAKKSPAGAKPAAKSAAGMSMNDILAAARGGDAATQTKEKGETKKKEPSKPAAKAAAMSVEDIMAAARGEAAPPADPPAEAPADPEPQPDSETAAANEPAAPEPAPTGDLPTDVAGIVAYCRECDS